MLFFIRLVFGKAYYTRQYAYHHKAVHIASSKERFL